MSNIETHDKRNCLNHGSYITRILYYTDDILHEFYIAKFRVDALIKLELSFLYYF